MKKYFIFFIIITAGLFSCKKSWLEIVPQGEQVAVTVDDYDKLMNDLAFYLYDNTAGLQEAQLMGDEVAAETPYFININVVRDRLFQWQDSIYPTAAVTSFTVTTLTEQMYQINKIVDEVMTSQGGTDAQKKGIRAEALATRAWTIFNLANYYCKPYLATTAGTDPGFPFSDEANVTQADFKRGTLQQTYDFIVKDLTDALQDIPQKQTYVTRMSKPAVEGLLGKVYLFMGRYSDAVPLLKSAITDVTANGQTSLYNYNQTFAAGGAFVPIDPVNGPKSPEQLMADVQEAVVSKVFNGGAYGGNLTGVDGLVLTPRAQALFGPNDLRLLSYTNKNIDNSPNAAGRIRKYGAKYSETYYRFGLQLPELYLLSAECRARTNDLAGAVMDVETLRRNRMPVADATVPATIAANQAALVKFIIDERTREFAMQGYRWFDMRRLSVDPLFAGTVITHTMFNTDGTTTVYTLKQPTRFVLKFPRKIMDANPDMQDNP